MADGGSDAEHSREVLYLGRADEPPRGSAGERPVTHPFRHWVIMVAVFLVGVMVGGYAWFVRADILESAHVDLIVTEIRHEPPHSDGTLTRVIVYVRNVGDEEVTVTDAWLPGMASAGDGDIREAVIPAGEKAAIALDGELNCGTGLPDVIGADVQTQDGVASAELPVPATNFVHASACRSAAGEVWVEPARGARGTGVEVAEPVESGLAVAIPLRIRSWSVDEVEVAHVAVSAVPGLDAEPSGLVGRHETHSVADLRVEWTVTGCSERYLGEPIDVTVTFADHRPATVHLPDAVEPMLVTIADQVCES